VSTENELPSSSANDTQTKDKEEKQGDSIEGHVKEDDEKIDFATWSTQELAYPEWAEPMVFELNEDDPYGPKGSRRSYTIEEAKTAFRQARYLVETHELSDEYTYYNLWKRDLAADALLFNQPQITYKIAEEFVNLEVGTFFYSRERNGEVTSYTIDDRGFRDYFKVLKFRAMAMAGYNEEAKTYFEENNLETTKENYLTLVWALSDIGMTTQAEALLTQGLNMENLGDRPHYIATNVLGAVAYYYTNGQYDKVIEIAPIVLDEGIDSTNELIFRGKDRSSGYYNNHWTSSYKLIEKYVELAERAKAGEVVDFNHLEDGKYTVDNTGYILTPMTVSLIVEDGGIKTLVADQLELPKDDRSGTAAITIPKGIKEKQTIQVDAISRATISSESARIGVIETLLEANKAVGEKTNQSETSDIVTVKGSGKGYNGPIKVEVDFVDEKISAIRVIDHHEDLDWYNRAKDGVIPAIIENQTTTVDSVSGATFSSKGIIEAVNHAIESKSNQ